MKRSEIIKKLHEKIQDKWDMPWNNYSTSYDESYTNFYSDVLTILEDLGMEPPDQYFTDGCGTEHWINTWEPESNEKTNIRIKVCDWCSTPYRWFFDPKSKSTTIQIYCEMCDTLYEEEYK